MMFDTVDELFIRIKRYQLITCLPLNTLKLNNLRILLNFFIRNLVQGRHITPLHSKIQYFQLSHQIYQDPHDEGIMTNCIQSQ